MAIIIPKTGAHVSPVDERDWTLASVGAPTAYPTSRFIEAVEKMSVTMQGQIGCCVGCTGEEVVRLIQILTGHEEENLSFRFVYAVCKALEGTDGYELYKPVAEGTYPALAAQVVRKYGVPLAKFCPNDVTLDHESFVYHRSMLNIPKEAFADALNRRTGADITVPLTEEGVKRAINYAADNKGGVWILRNIGNTYWMKDGVTTYDKAKLIPIEPQALDVSGHEELLYGYDVDPTNGRTRIYWLNHWSEAWCSTGGYGKDGGRAWEYLDVWLKNIREIRVSVYALPEAPQEFTYSFSRALSIGMKGADVVALQHILDLEGVYDYAGTPKYTGYFGSFTKQAVIALQGKYASEILTPVGLSHGTGYVGSSTLAWLKKHYSPST